MSIESIFILLFAIILIAAYVHNRTESFLSAVFAAVLLGLVAVAIIL